MYEGPRKPAQFRRRDPILLRRRDPILLRVGANGSQTQFLKLFDSYVKQPVIQNPGLLRKSGWTPG
jgi:hypothetical protein